MAVPDISTLKFGKNTDLSKFIGLVPSIGAILISVSIAFFIVWPKFNEVLRLQESNKSLSDQAQKLGEKVSILQSLVSQESLLDTQLGAADQLLPSDKSTFKIIQQIEKAVSDSGVLLDKLDTAPGSVVQEANESSNSGSSAAPVASSIVEEVGSSLPSLKFNIAITGDYSSFLRFLRNSLLITRVVSLDGLGVSASSDGNTIVSSSFTIDAFWQPLPSVIGNIEAPIESLTPDEEEVLSDVTLPDKIESTTPSEVATGRTDIFSPF